MRHLTIGSLLLASSLVVFSATGSAEEAPEKMPWEKGPSGALNLCPAALAEGDSLELKNIRACVDASGGRLNRSYQQALRSHPTAEGTVVLHFGISADGSVVDLAVDESSSFPRGSISHIVSSFSGIKFPTSSKGWKGQYQLVFMPQ